MEIAFLGMIFSSSGVRPDPQKVKDLENLFPPPKNWSELKSFICMMQSNSYFILNFSKSISTLREHLNSDKHYKLEMHYKKETFLSSFNISKPTIIFTDIINQVFVQH